MFGMTIIIHLHSAVHDIFCLSPIIDCTMIFIIFLLLNQQFMEGQTNSNTLLFV